MKEGELDSIATRIIAIVAKKTGKKPETITMGTRLLHDLCLYGDDAEEVLLEIGRAFDVDYSGFEFQRYFFPEGFALWMMPEIVRRRFMERKLALTITQLAVVATSRSWRGTSKNVGVE